MVFWTDSLEDNNMHVVSHLLTWGTTVCTATALCSSWCLLRMIAKKWETKYLILQSQKIKLYDLLCIFLRGWVREFNYAKSTVLIDRVIFASWHYEIMLWTCCYTRKGCWLARLGRVSVAVVHGWTDETAHLEYAKRKSNPRKEHDILWWHVILWWHIAIRHGNMSSCH